MQESYFWGPGQPTTSTTNNYAYITGKYTDGYYDCDANRLTQLGLMCEYLDPYSFADFEKACLLSPYPSATGYLSCFTLIRNAITFDTAQGKCTEFPGGFLARVNTVDMGTFISTALWAKTGLPPTMPLFNGLRRYSSQWYWMNPDGTKSTANTTSLPWDAGQPLTGDCALLGQNGLLKTGSCTTNQWYLCQYRNKLYEFNRGIADLKASPSVVMSETYNMSFRQCRQSCQNNGDCTSFSHSSSNNTCQLISGNSKATVAASGFNWYKPEL
uniref:C-type lectin domain-containing protein n=1 Tax=Plectus sambesii TaxID=2011161 RepID=A0A914XJ93_9BILA